MKPNWVSSNCGMWSSKKFSVKRHITNQHSGNAFIVPYIDYLVGRQSGLYPPSAPPEYQYREKKRNSDTFRGGILEGTGKKICKTEIEITVLIYYN